MTWRKYPYIPQVNRRGSVDFTYRPLVEIVISEKKVSERFMALVDSGTDVTMMDAEIARVLGIDISKCKTAIASGVGGTKPGFLAKVHVQVPGYRRVITTTVLFVENLSFNVILGQDDFFRNFVVRFDRNKYLFYLKLADK
jgi:hypothetical protein